jgi:hypothetical protein
MSQQLHTDLISKMRTYPETVYVPPAKFKINDPAVFQHVDAGDRGQMLLVLGSDGTIRIYSSDPRPLRPFEVTADGKTTAADADLNAILEAVPLPQPNSMWAYGNPSSDLTYALVYWRRIQPAMIASPLEPAAFTVNGHELPVHLPTSDTWLADAAEGWLRCIDEDLAGGRQILTFGVHPDRKNTIQFLYQGLDYRLTGPLSGPAHKVPPGAGDPAVLAGIAAECTGLRDQAASLLYEQEAA